MTQADSAQLVEIGSKAPAVALRDQHGQLHRLSQHAGQWVVLYFYPKDNTAGCTTEACGFRDQVPAFGSVNAVVLGVSPDDEKSHAKFAGKFELPFTLLADPDHKALASYGVWQEKSMYGRKYMGVVRTTYLIDPKGKVAARWDKVKVAGHIAQVLETLNKLQQA